jgi:hypothetical protein
MLAAAWAVSVLAGMALYSGLGVEPLALSRNLVDESTLEEFLQSNLADSPGLWLMLYKEKNSPLPRVVRRWSEGRFDLREQEKLGEVRLLHYEALAKRPLRR